MSPPRDPSTGQFVADDEDFDDIEQVSADFSFSFNPDGTGGDDYPSALEFAGEQLIDYDEVVDRNESLHLLRASHHLMVFVRANAGAPGSVRGALEISTSPARQVAEEYDSGRVLDADVTVTNGATPQVRADGEDDTIDLIGPVLVAGAEAVHQDVGSSTGSGASRSDDSVTLEGFPDEIGRFHPRDELFVNGVLEASGVDVTPYAELSVQHVYGVLPA